MAADAKVTGKRIAFVICPIGEEGSEVRKRSDQVLKYVITPPVEKCGYEPLRADKIADPGLITSQIIQHLIDDSLVVADLTGSNPNVFYELAIRHAVRKPFIQLVNKGEKLPFDIAGMRTISVELGLDAVEEAKAEIEKQIKAVEGKPQNEIESPISASVQLQSLKESNRPEERSMGEILEALTSLRNELNSGMASLKEERTFRSLALENQKQLEELMILNHGLKRERAELEKLFGTTDKALMAIAAKLRMSWPELIRHFEDEPFLSKEDIVKVFPNLSEREQLLLLNALKKAG